MLGGGALLLIVRVEWCTRGRGVAADGVRGRQRSTIVDGNKVRKEALVKGEGCWRLPLKLKGQHVHVAGRVGTQQQRASIAFGMRTYLDDGIQELDKNRLAKEVTQPEAVAKGAPLLLDECGEAMRGPIVLVNHELCKGRHLRSTIPTVGAMEKDTSPRP